MSIQTAAQEIVDACNSVDEELTVSITASEVTLYWNTLRLGVSPKDLCKAFKVIRDAKGLGARFE